MCVQLRVVWLYHAEHSVLDGNTWMENERGIQSHTSRRKSVFTTTLQGSGRRGSSIVYGQPRCMHLTIVSIVGRLCALKLFLSHWVTSLLYYRQVRANLINRT